MPPRRTVVAGGTMLEWKGKDRLRRFRQFCRAHVIIPHGFGAGEPMTLHPPQVRWVKAIIEALVVVISVAKGNAKSTTLAAVALWWAVDPPEGDVAPEIIIVAGSKDQARQGVYSTCVAIVEASPWLAARSHIYTDVNDPRIEFDNGAVIRIRAAHPGRLHGIIPSLMILDEIGLVTDARVWTTLVQSLGKRPGATCVGIGTPGWERNSALWTIKVEADTGKLLSIIRFIEHACHPDADVADTKAWIDANPVRAAIDPAGWVDTLRLIRADPNVSDADFRLFHMCQWPDMSGAPVVSSDRWAELELTELAELETIEQDLLWVTIDGDWQRRNVACVAAFADDDRVNIVTLGVWEDSLEQVPSSDLIAAATALGLPGHVRLGRSMQSAEIKDTLEGMGADVEEVNTASAADMRDPTDHFLEGVESGRYRHDGRPELAAHVVGARQDIRKDGVVFMRDDRTDQRIDGLVCAAVSAHGARTTPAGGIY